MILASFSNLLLRYKNKKMVDFLGTFALLTLSPLLLPQVYKIFYTKSAKDISIIYLICHYVTALSWYYYGIAISRPSIFIANLIVFVSINFLIIGKILYNK